MPLKKLFYPIGFIYYNMAIIYYTMIIIYYTMITIRRVHKIIHHFQINLLTINVPHHIETSQLIWKTLIINELKGLQVFPEYFLRKNACN